MAFLHGPEPGPLRIYFQYAKWCIRQVYAGDGARAKSARTYQMHHLVGAHGLYVELRLRIASPPGRLKKDRSPAVSGRARRKGPSTKWLAVLRFGRDDGHKSRRRRLLSRGQVPVRGWKTGSPPGCRVAENANREGEAPGEQPGAGRLVITGCPLPHPAGITGCRFLATLPFGILWERLFAFSKSLILKTLKTGP